MDVFLKSLFKRISCSLLLDTYCATNTIDAENVSNIETQTILKLSLY